MATPSDLSVQLREPLAADLPATLDRLAGLGSAHRYVSGLGA
ncbi:hypothetical protein [Rathayibacter tanaceti]|uniref:Uncharacterized protein n=2 Tax=Rathayibacter tanaceti TaxID=1671680 RepID=A0ACD2XJT9_9MICO|nr:hypothetical protein [Rathayibacter tanaceti]KZX22572.1 hypothetical protein ACH61_00339 [Rathayibacter tanaceti]TCO37428.1 hypothetical protein EV639_10493 [Rathayibacter tanaceti]